MSSCIFSSPFLKFKNGKIYQLSCDNDFKLLDYENEVYYIDYTDIKIQKSFDFLDHKIKYDIISYENDKNIVIKLISDKEIQDDNDIIKMMYLIESHITHINMENINYMNDVYNNTNNDIINKYNSRFIRV
jgi:hypothetical protein